MQENEEEKQQEDSVDTAYLRCSGNAQQGAATYRQKDDAAEKHEGNIVGEKGFLHLHGMEKGHDTNYHEYIEDVGTDYVTDGDAGVPLDRGNDAYDEFGRGRTESNNSETDHEVGDSPAFGQGGGAVGERVGAGKDQRQSSDKTDNIKQHINMFR